MAGVPANGETQAEGLRELGEAVGLVLDRQRNQCEARRRLLDEAERLDVEAANLPLCLHCRQPLPPENQFCDVDCQAAFFAARGTQGENYLQYLLSAADMVMALGVARMCSGFAGTTDSERIVAFRSRTPFSRPEDLVRVKGFGKKKLDKLRGHLTVAGPTTLKVSTGKEDPGGMPESPALQGRSAPSKH